MLLNVIRRLNGLVMKARVSWSHHKSYSTRTPNAQ